MNTKVTIVLFLVSAVVAAPMDRIAVNEMPPVPVGGYEALQHNIQYPEIARVAGTRGVVIIEALVNETGQVIQTVVVQGISNTGLNEAAIEGVRRTRFIPARQHGRPISVWISIPVEFQL